MYSIKNDFGVRVNAMPVIDGVDKALGRVCDSGVFNLLYATGAYGRKYDCLDDILIDYLDGKDFRVVNGSYFSIRDADVLRSDGYEMIDVDGWLIPIN